MTMCSTIFHIGGKVRDRANLGGTIVHIFNDEARVHWNNGYYAWIKTERLTLDHGESERTAPKED